MKKLAIILLLCVTGCMHELTAPLSTVPVTSMADYFWTHTPISFKDDSTGAIMDKFTFTDSANLLLTQDADANSKPRTTIYCSVSADTVFAKGFSYGSIIDLDNGTYFTSLDTVTLVPHALGSGVLSGSDGSAFVSTDSGVWLSPAGHSFAYDGIDSIGDITSMVSPTTGAIYAGTRSGQIWMRNPTGGKTWTLLSTNNLGPITSIAFESGVIYAVIKGQTGVYQVSYGGGAWAPSTLLRTQTVTLLRTADVNGTVYLVAGSSVGDVAGIPISGTGLKFSFTITPADSITDIIPTNTPGIIVAAKNGIYQGSVPGTSLSPVYTLAGIGATSLVHDDLSSSLFYISDGTLFAAHSNSGTFGGPSPIQKFYDGGPLKLLNGIVPQTIYLLTTTGFYKHNSSIASTWDTVKGFPATYYPNLQGGLLLLKSNPEIDSSWRAGTLVTNNNRNSYPITARLLNRLDSLRIGGKSYADVLVMQYSHEMLPGQPDNNLPYWVIYYQRGRGPIMIDRLKDTSSPPERRVVTN